MERFSDWLAQAEAVPVVSTFLTAVVGFVAYYLLSRGLKRMTARTWLTPTMEGRVRVLLRWFVFIVVGLIVLQNSGLINHAWAILSGFFAVAAVSFVATWSVLSNGVCAVIILIYRPFEVGDTIEILDASDKPGFKGKVVDINLIFTKLRTGDDGDLAYLQVPNNMFMQRTIRRFASDSEA